MAETELKNNAPADSLPQEPGYGYINGRFVPLHEAAIPLLDWGFNKSDVVYDGIPFDQGLIFRLDDHLRRFEESMDKWRLPYPCDRDTIASVCHELVSRSGLRSGIIYICTTRGIPPSAEIRDPAQFTSRLYGWSQRLPQLGASMDGGLSMIISSIPRIPQSSVDATAKNFHWGDLIQARLEAGDKGAQNAILLGHAGHVAEGVGFNVFVVKNGAITTPAYDCLKGITRRTAMEIAESLGISCEEADISEQELLEADEIFISSSAGGMFPVTRLNDLPVGSGEPGSITSKINATYWEWRASPEYTTPVSYG
ncbi:MAG: aminotransferase class IV [Pseudomonadota bacterium]